MKKLLFIVSIIALGAIILSCDIFIVKPPINPNDPNYDAGADPDYVFHPPTSLLAIDQDGEVLITWIDNVSVEEGFILERSISDTSSFAEIYRSSANVQSYTDITTQYNSTYFYRICSYKAGEDISYYSDPVEMRFYDETPPNPAESLNANASGPTVTLSWVMPQNHDAAGLLILRGTSAITWVPTDGDTYTEDDNVTISERIILIDEVLDPPSQFTDTGLNTRIQ